MTEEKELVEESNEEVVENQEETETKENQVPFTIRELLEA